MTDSRKRDNEVFDPSQRALEQANDVVEKEKQLLISKKPFKLAEEYWNTLGPGLVTGAADDDPSGIATYSQTGAQYGFQLLWLSLFTFPFMAMVQEICARIGIVTGHGLAANIRHRYSKSMLYFITVLLFIANTLNIAADLGAMAASTRLLMPGLNFILCVTVFGFTILILQIFTTYARYSKILKYSALALLSYVVTAFAVHLPWGEVLKHTVSPSLTFSRDQIFLLCAILGTTISPYLFFWQTSQEVEEEVLKGGDMGDMRSDVDTQKELKVMRKDTWSGMFFSNLIMFFIIAACAGTLYAHGITNIATADQAAAAIRPFGGDFTYFLFAVGIIGTGFLAIPTMAGASAYAAAESFGWRQGLNLKLKQAYAFYGVIAFSIVIAIIANYIHLDPIKGLIYSAVANGLVAPVVLFFIMRISTDKKVMGADKNHPFISACGWLTTVLMAIVGIAAIVTMFF